jgi:uncharacterized protein (TIGR01777 family)
MPESLIKRSSVPVSARTLWEWYARPDAFARLNPPWAPVELLERSGGLEVGARTVVRMRFGLFPQTWVAEHTDYEEGRMFRDAQQSGPFASWVHTHRFLEEAEDQSILEDAIEYVLPMAGLGRTFAGGFTRKALTRVFDYRHQITQLDLQRHAQFASRPRLKVAISGASGLIGSTLKEFLSTGGHEVRPMRRGATGSQIDLTALEGADAIVHLAGAGIAEGRWTNERKGELVKSRIDFTRALVKALGTLSSPPTVLVAASAVGIYGDRGDEVLTEESPIGPGGDKGAAFLAQLCEDWENESRAAETLGIRVVRARMGVVQSAKGGALAKMLAPFRAGAGGPIAGGKQWMSWVGLEDAIGALHHALFTDSVKGPVNVVSPQPVTNGEYGKTLGQVLSRPAIAPLPAFALRAGFGEMADGALLASQRAKPGALEASGYTFVHPVLEDALRFTLGR